MGSSKFLFSQDIDRFCFMFCEGGFVKWKMNIYLNRNNFIYRALVDNTVIRETF